MLFKHIRLCPFCIENIVNKIHSHFEREIRINGRKIEKIEAGKREEWLK